MNRPQETSQHDLLPALVEAVKTTRATVAKTKRKLAIACYQKENKNKNNTAVAKVLHTALGLWTLRFCFVYFVQLVFKKLKKE